MRPAALTLRRLRSMRDEVLHNIRSHCAQVYKKPKEAEICRSAALIAAAEIADVLKEKYGIDISPTAVAGLGIDEVKRSLISRSAKFMKPLQHPTHEWVIGPHGPVFVPQREADIIRKWPASQRMSQRTLGAEMTEGKKAFLREQLAPRFPHLAPFLETFDWKKSSIDDEIRRQEAQTQGPYRYFALKNLETLRNMRLNWADVLEGLGEAPSESMIDALVEHLMKKEWWPGALHNLGVGIGHIARARKTAIASGNKAVQAVAEKMLEAIPNSLFEGVTALAALSALGKLPSEAAISALRNRLLAEKDPPNPLFDLGLGIGFVNEARKKAIANGMTDIQAAAEKILSAIPQRWLRPARVTLAGLMDVTEPLEEELLSIQFASDSIELAKRAIAQGRGRDALSHIGNAWISASKAIDRGENVQEANEILKAASRLATFLKFKVAGIATPPAPEHVRMLEKVKSSLETARGGFRAISEGNLPSAIRTKISLDIEGLLRRALEMTHAASIKAEEAGDLDTRREIPEVAYSIIETLQKVLKSR